MVFLTEAPVTTETLPELPTVKSKLLILKAFALSSVSVETVIGPEYFLDDCFGEEPSIV